MTARLSLTDAALQQAALQLSTAATLLAAARTPELPESGARRLRVSHTVIDFLRTVETGRRALVDAAHATSCAVAEVQARHGDLDRYLAGVAPKVHAVPGMQVVPALPLGPH